MAVRTNARYISGVFLAAPASDFHYYPYKMPNLNTLTPINASIANYTAHANSTTVWQYERVLQDFDMDSIIVFAVFLFLLIATVICIRLVAPKNRYARLNGNIIEYEADNINDIELHTIEPLSPAARESNRRHGGTPQNLTDEDIASASV